MEPWIFPLPHISFPSPMCIGWWMIITVGVYFKISRYNFVSPSRGYWFYEIFLLLWKLREILSFPSALTALNRFRNWACWKIWKQILDNKFWESYFYDWTNINSLLLQIWKPESLNVVINTCTFTLYNTDPLINQINKWEIIKPTGSNNEVSLLSVGPP